MSQFDALSFIEKVNVPITSFDIKTAFGISHSRASENLRKLYEKGKIKRLTKTTKRGIVTYYERL